MNDMDFQVAPTVFFPSTFWFCKSSELLQKKHNSHFKTQFLPSFFLKQYLQNIRNSALQKNHWVTWLHLRRVSFSLSLSFSCDIEVNVCDVCNACEYSNGQVACPLELNVFLKIYYMLIPCWLSLNLIFLLFFRENLVWHVLLNTYDNIDWNLKTQLVHFKKPKSKIQFPLNFGFKMNFHWQKATQNSLSLTPEV
jgi:hypothetical protein